MAKQPPKPTHEDLQRDEIAEGVGGAIEWLHENRHRIVIGMLLIVVLVVAIGAYRSHAVERRETLNAQFRQMMSRYARLQTATAVDERNQVAQALATDLDQLQAEHGNARVAREALYLKGQTLYSIDDFEGARAAHENYLNLAETREERARAHIALGYAYENQAFFPSESTETRQELIAQAQEHYEQAAQIAGERVRHLHYYALLGQARTHEVRGQNEEAIALYEQVAEESLANLETFDLPEEIEEGPETQMIRGLRSLLQTAREQATLSATANLRLQRLRAQAGLAQTPATVTSSSP